MLGLFNVLVVVVPLATVLVLGWLMATTIGARADKAGYVGQVRRP